LNQRPDLEAKKMIHSTPKEVKRTLNATRSCEDGIHNNKKRKLTPDVSKEIRLAQNRKAAKESRKRKKSMIEELQRSLVFFSKANTTLKQQNDDLDCILTQAQTQVAKVESSAPSLPAQVPITQQPVKEAEACNGKKELPSTDGNSNTAQAPGNSLELLSAIATPASVALHGTLPLMQPGATMQEMANFQQATAAAMQAAAHGIGAFHAPALRPEE
jgi:hypothetical protein